MAQRFDDQACQFVAMKEFFNGDSLVPETNELMQQIFEVTFFLGGKSQTLAIIDLIIGNPKADPTK
jgi:hypothetical protein